MADQRFQNVINGELVDSVSGETYDVIDPTTGEVYAQAPMSGAEDVDRAYAAAGRGLRVAGATPRRRTARTALLKIADAIEARVEEINAVECKDTGKPLGLTMSEEMPYASDHFRFFAGAARVLEGRSAGEYMADHTSWVRREPVGVVGQVTPWNYPLMMMIWKIAPALAGGNTIVLKPSDTTPASSTLLAELCQEFLPPGVLNVVCGDRDTGRALVEHKTPQMVAITGSVRAGMEVAGSAAADLKRVHLELGGKAPVIVFDDADIEKAAEGIAEAGLLQRRPGLHRRHPRARRPRRPRRLRRRAHRGGQGHHDRRCPTTRTSSTAPLNNENQLDRVTGMVDRLPDHADRRDRRRPPGRRAATSTSRPCSPASSRTTSRSRPRSSARSSPCRSSPTRPRRCAGPTASSTASPRASGPRTTAGRCGCRSSLDFGVVWINTHIPFVSEMPHGGFKHSGYGKDLSMYGLEDYTRIKHVMSYIGE